MTESTLTIAVDRPSLSNHHDASFNNKVYSTKLGEDVLVHKDHYAFEEHTRDLAEIREEGLDHKYSPYNQRTGKEPPLKGRFNGRRSWASKRAAASVFFLNSLTEVATDWEQGNDITLK
ncbi:hypothetical protein BLNAU_4761 [Blattamonas nauphoetae]|nr:hypothetical protein BLNAU_4761 [Blattamonas nauphoetae]